MTILYIDNDAGTGQTFALTAAAIAREKKLQCTVIGDAKNAVLELLDPTSSPDYIFVHSNLSDIPCVALLSFIAKQDHLQQARVVVIASRFSSRDRSKYFSLQVHHCLKWSGAPGDLTVWLSKIVGC